MNEANHGRWNAAASEHMTFSHLLAPYSPPLQSRNPNIITTAQRTVEELLVLFFLPHSVTVHNTEARGNAAQAITVSCTYFPILEHFISHYKPPSNLCPRPLLTLA